MASQGDHQQRLLQGTSLDRLRLRRAYQQRLLATFVRPGAQPPSQVSAPPPQRRTAVAERSNSSTPRYVPSPPPNSPRLSTASARAWHLVGLDRDMLNLRACQCEDDEANSSATGILGLPKKVREEIWGLVLVQSRTAVVCGCKWVLYTAIDSQDLFSRTCEPLCLALTQVCRALRHETIPIFYSSNRFVMPIGHGTTKTAHDWLQSLSTQCRRFIRHLEVPSFAVTATAISMKQTAQLELATNLAVRRTITCNGQQVEVFWPIFRAVIPEIDTQSFSTSMVDSVGSSIFDSVSDLSISGEETAMELPIFRLTSVDGQETEPPELVSRSTAILRRSKERSSNTNSQYCETSSNIVADRLRATRYSSRSWVLLEDGG